jgi:hypothetical protein
MRIYFTTDDNCPKCSGEGFVFAYAADSERFGNQTPTRVLCGCAIKRVAVRFDPNKEKNP